jgi:hypothetical protein
MASTSPGAAGTPKETVVQLVELPTVKNHPSPVEEWSNPTKGACPLCGQSVWYHDTVNRALADPRYRGVCSVCIKVERERQALL